MKLGTHGLPMRSAALAKRRRRLRILAALAAVCVFGFVAVVAREVWPQRAEVIADVSAVFTEPDPAGALPVAAPASERPVYRHSIVPGGAYSRAEVADAMRRDAVVAAHYEHIDVEKVHAKRIDVPRAVYVSYRVGNQVYWSKNRVRLSPGETVLTDGKTEIRARCGNLLSDDAQQPVAGEEPPLAALDEADPETGSSTMAGARGPEGALAHVPFLPGPNGTSGSTLDGLATVPGLPGGVTPPMWRNGGGGGASPSLGSSTGTNGTSLVAPLGGSERNNSSGDGSNGGGSNGGGSNDGGSNGGGSNGGGSNEGGSNGGGSNEGGSNEGGSNSGGSNGGGDDEEPPKFIPPTTTGDPETTTTGDPVTTTTGNTVNDTTGGDDTHTVPEPGTLVLLGLGACGLASRALRARRR